MATAAPSDTQLPRVLGPWMATALVIGTVIGSGVFKKPHAVAKDLTEFGLIMMAWVLVGLLAFFGSIVLAEVAVIHPRAGGNYVFLREGYGRWAGFLWGWVEFWIIRSGSIAALASVFTESFHDVLRYLRGVDSANDVLSFWELQGVTVTLIAVLAVVNARGTVLGGGLQVGVTAVKVLSLLSIALLPFVFLAFANDSPVSAARLEPIWPASVGAINWSRFGSAMVAIIWSYHGWMNLAPMAEEVKEPNCNLPLGFLMGTLAVMGIYLSVNVAYHLVVSRQDMVELGGKSAVATVFASSLLGPIGVLLVSTALMISVFGSLNGNLLVGPRLLFAMGKDGLAPSALCQLHAKYRTPVLAVAVLAGWSILLVLGMAFLVDIGTLKKSIFDSLTDYAMFGAVSFETMAVASIFICRRQYPLDKVELPYRSWGYPWVPIFYVSVMAAVLANMFVNQTTESLIGIGFIGVGAVLYAAVFKRPAISAVGISGSPSSLWPEREGEAGEAPAEP